MCVGSGNPPNWLLNPNTDPDGPTDCVTPGSNCTRVWMSRPTIGTWSRICGCTSTLKLDAVDSTSGASACTFTVSASCPIFKLPSTVIVVPAFNSMLVSSKVANPWP